MLSAVYTLHTLATIIWVGGMFFAHFAMRPVAEARMDPPARLPFMRDVLGNFFPWVWGSFITLIVTGYWIVFNVYGGLESVPMHLSLMGWIGLLMSAIFLFVYFVPYAKMKQALDAGEIPVAGKNMAMIRRVILTNLMLGMITSILAVAGRYMG